jgi:thiamine pyrophosphate-dependent acetolactate synthase large subunit-like protein
MPSPTLLQKAAKILDEGKKVVILVGRGALDASDEVLVLSDMLKDNAIISVDSGTNTIWATQYIQIKEGINFLSLVL